MTLVVVVRVSTLFLFLILAVQTLILTWGYGHTWATSSGQKLQWIISQFLTSHHLEIVLHLVLQLIIVDWMWCFQGPTWFMSFVLNAGLVQLQLFTTLVYLELLYHILEYWWHLLTFSKYLIFKKWLIYLKGDRFSLILGAF